MTLIEKIKNGEVTEELKTVSKDESIPLDILRESIINGKLVIPRNKLRSFKPLAIGFMASTKVNANIGTSQLASDPAIELEKMRIAVKAGAHSIMDLSTGGDIPGLRRLIIEHSPVMVGTVPIYEAAAYILNQKQKLWQMDPELLFDTIESHCMDGVDYITVHCGITQKTVEELDKSDRILNIVSRGGGILAQWIRKNKKENPLYDQFDRLVKIAKEYDVTLSLGDGMRPGSIVDANDKTQLDELKILSELAIIAHESGVQVIIEGPGHMKINEIIEHVKLQKKMCCGAPFYVLGPLVTDIAPGYDHITSAIGGAIAASAGVDFLCYVTPAEHLCLPTNDDVKQGVIAARIAAHAGDLVKRPDIATKKDLAISRARKTLDWNSQFRLAIDPDEASSRREQSGVNNDDGSPCTMCGELCPLKLN